ncbi:hypothetical protein AB0N99_31085 [Streptomyces sp. NPDC093272]|uniref:hypothetical protein n=1 Tax=Streptomyces sp. NPDC093272 TaxID=3154981 RepID=UPI0034417EB3
MDTIKRIYRASERRLIPRRPCPDCRTPIPGHWTRHPDMTGEIDPRGDVEWRCHGRLCINGKESF